MRLIKLNLIFCLFILGFGFSCSKNPTAGDDGPGNGYVYVQPPETGDGWQTAALNDVGISETKIVDLINNIQKQVYQEVHAVVIIKDGKLVFEEYYPGHDFGYYGANYHVAFINFKDRKSVV
jgi:hypothetical protein